LCVSSSEAAGELRAPSRARARDASRYRTETEAALSEERRACFVGVCRAETHLTLTRIEQYRGFQKPPSIFLEEMGIDPYD
jgi:superfamily I DNA/RNA helicase